MYKSNQQKLLSEMNKACDVAVWNHANFEKNSHGVDWDLVQSEIWTKLGSFIEETKQAALAASWFDWSVEDYIKARGG